MSEASGQRLPPGWAEATIEDLFSTLEDGRTLHQGWSPQCEKAAAPTDADWGVLKTTAIQAGAFLPQHNKHLPVHLTPRPQIEVKAGDILITCAGPRVRCGVACLVRNTRPRLMLSGKMYRFRVSADRVDARFLEAYLLTPKAIATIDKMKTGGSDSGLNLTHDRFRPLPVPVAPLSEQRRIVDAIDSYLTRLDDAVANLERVQAKLKAYRASVLTAAVEGRLVPTEASLARAKNRAYETADALLARILKERRRRWEGAELARLKAAGKTRKDDRWKANYQGPVALDTSRLPELPEGWTHTRIEAMIDSREGMKTGPFGTLLKKHEHIESGVPVLGIENIEPMRFVRGSKIHLTKEKAQQLAAYSVEADDLLISRSGTVGEVCVVPNDIGDARCSTNVMRVRFLITGPLPAFFSVLLNGSPFIRDQIRNLCKGTTRDFLNQRILSSLVFSLPPLDEQTRILAAVDEKLSVADAVSDTCGHSQVRASRLRQAILKWAFEGKLVNQDPTDQPADRLLTLIRAERAVIAPTKKSRGRPAKGAA